MSTDCIVYRCGRQDEMYLYLRADLKPEDLPEALRRLTGKLTQAMQLSLAPERRLARVDVAQVLEKLAAPGYYIQMPPDGILKANLHFGD
ncbi:YcgL domain-containing protein [Solimonas sp. K1W22B-7]|uniref:YcgL domain-containing protein n=1 Tax=Solimonas sp. K1W22B-7 TaxID=2303331 RepID=UPI000E332EF6|nr:YcgL domain-containing protein [Solimonas sp. K1W22B-7]AXQ28658.1 YcgL domain-containing protein [Solimonas sp. K1W22B-7]